MNVHQDIKSIKLSDARRFRDEVLSVRFESNGNRFTVQDIQDVQIGHQVLARRVKNDGSCDIVTEFLQAPFSEIPILTAGMAQEIYRLQCNSSFL